MCKQPKVSYIIVTWNNEEIIKECIDTLIKYSPCDNEVIVVDNASKDETCNVIKNLNYSEVLLIESAENLGFSKANNVGLNRATGEYVFFVNPDVIFIEDIMTAMIRVLDENPEIGIVSPMLLNKDGSFQSSCCNFPRAKKVLWDDCHLFKILPKEKQMQYAQAQYRGNQNRTVDWTYGAAQLCRFKDVKAIGGYPEISFMYGEDTELCMSFLNKLQKTTYYLASSRLIHLGGYSEKQTINSRKTILVTNAAMSFVHRYYGKKALKRYRMALGIASFLKSGIYGVKYFFSHNLNDKARKMKWKVSLETVLKNQEWNTV